MAKEDIFSKINLKDYNNILENILEQKDFSEDVKNLLLSMLYKIENGYEDYKTVKVNVNSKKYFLRKLVQIIKEDCKKIELIKPLSEESKILEQNKVNYIVNREERKIIVYPNERIILEALITLNQKEIFFDEKYELFEMGFKEILTIGNRMNFAESIRDFNGWSWDITTSQMESKNINIVYQNLLMLLSNSFIQSLITDGNINDEEDEDIQLPNNEILRSKYNENFGITKEDLKEEKIDYIEKLNHILIEKYGKEKAEIFIEQFIKIIIAIGSNKNNKQKEIVLKKQKEIQEKLDKMQDNKKYLEEISKIKKEITLKIKKIDTLLNHEKLLKEEYDNVNKTLPNKEKIFSTSHFKIMLEKDRRNYLEKIKEYNNQISPKEFVRIKSELEKQNEFFEDLDIKENKNIEEEKQIEKLQIYFLDCFIEKIKKAESKKEITDLIYEIRYYKQLPYKEENVAKIDNCLEKIEQIENMLIKKGCELKLLTKFSKDDNLNKKILENLFNSKIINLDNTIYVLKYNKGILNIQILDGNIEEDIKEIKITEKVELQVKLNKKIKVWE